MLTSGDTLLSILENNVVELKFKRKRKKEGSPSTRRMLCTRAIKNLYNPKLNFLDSAAGYNILHFKKPPKMPQLRVGMTYNWKAKGDLLMVWDIFRQDWRVICTDDVDVIWTIPANNDFWTIFNLILKKMTPNQKLLFENK